MHARNVLAGLVFPCAAGGALSQEKEENAESGPLEGLDPLGQCLEIGRMRYERFAAELEIERDAGECPTEYESYQKQCYQLHR